MAIIVRDIPPHRDRFYSVPFRKITRNTTLKEIKDKFLFHIYFPKNVIQSQCPYILYFTDAIHK